MATATTIPPKAKITVSEGPTLLHGVPWHVYEYLVEELGESHVWLTYDGGTLEILSPSYRHERWRKGIYAKLGVPELWCFDGETLRVLLRNNEGEYVPADRSPTFPVLPLAEVPVWIQRSGAIDDNTWKREFRAWVRDLIARDAPA